MAPVQRAHSCVLLLHVSHSWGFQLIQELLFSLVLCAGFVSIESLLLKLLFPGFFCLWSHNSPSNPKICNFCDFSEASYGGNCN